jgi:hypothetical protein
MCLCYSAGGPLPDSSFHEAMTAELELVKVVIEMYNIETDALVALARHGMTMEMLGNTETAPLSATELETILNRISEVQKKSTISLSQLNTIVTSVHMMHDMRTAIIGGNWSRVKDLVAECTVKEAYALLPEACKTEIVAVQGELENREIMSKLSTALLAGRLEGNVGEINFDRISFRALEVAINSLKTVVIKTEEAGILLYSAMQVLRLRQYALESPTPWGKIKSYASGLLSPSQISRLHPSTIAEIKLILAVVLDSVLCKTLHDAILSGSVSGAPGKVNYSGVSVLALENAIEQVEASPTTLTERAQQMSAACKILLPLRELLLRTVARGSEVTDTRLTEDTWVSIRTTFISEMYKIAGSNPSDAGWSVCKNEIILLAKEAHLQECLAILTDTVDVACGVYAKRQQASIGNGDKDSIYAPIPVNSLDTALRRATEKPELVSPYLEKIADIIRKLRDIREMINCCEWANVKKAAKNTELLRLLQGFPFVMEEIKLAYQDAHNNEMVIVIDSALNRPFKSALSLDEEEVELALTSESLLKEAIHKAESSTLTSLWAQQLLDCARHLLQLRVSLRLYDATAFAKLVRWFRTNANVCPASILAEVEKSENLFENFVALKRIGDALSRGSATARNGGLDMSTVDVSELTSVMREVEAVRYPTEDLKAMIHVCDMIIALRTAQRSADEDGIRIAVDRIASSNFAIHPSIVVEVSDARADVGNKTAIAILTAALQQFKPGEVKPERGVDSIEDTAVRSTLSPPRPANGKFMSPRSANSKKLSRKNSGRLDAPMTPTVALENALTQAESHGIFTAEAKRLKKTALFVLSLRYAIEADDWFKVEQLLRENDQKTKTRRKSFVPLDDVAGREIHYVRVQLEVMSSLVDLGKHLKSGWATCSNGIVDVSTLEVEPLQEAILKTERSLADYAEADPRGRENESSNTDVFQESGAGITVGSGKVDKEPLRRLLVSAKEILLIRSYLRNGDINLAASHAERVLNSAPHPITSAELQLYYVEIGHALHMIRLCRSLRGSMRLGNVEALEASIFEAKEASLQLSGDLGLLRTLERAVEVYQSIIKAHSHLKEVAKGFDKDSIERALNTCIQLNMSGVLIEKVKKRLALLKRFEQSVADVTAKINSTTKPLEIQEFIDQMAIASGLPDHPIALRARVLMRLSGDSLRTALLAEAVFAANVKLASCVTIPIRRQYLSLSASSGALSLDKFPGLRDISDFSSRMLMDVQDLRITMLQHTEEPIVTSLTRLSPCLAALSVWIFRHCIRGIEESEYSHPEVILRNLVSLGRFSIPMRNEIFVQIIKQIRENPNEPAVERLWLTLLACIEHFPPSQEFESFLEFFLTEELNLCSNSKISELISSCIVQLHEMVFRYGYDKRISTQWDASLKRMSALLSIKHRLSSVKPHGGTLSYSLSGPMFDKKSRRHSLLSGQQFGGVSKESFNLDDSSHRPLIQKAGGNSELSNCDNAVSLKSPSSFEISGSPLPTKKKASRRSSVAVTSKDREDLSSERLSLGDPDIFFARSRKSEVSPFETEPVEGNAVGDTSMDSRLRGTVDNWIHRFKALSNGKDFVSYDKFADGVKGELLDQRDKEIFAFLLMGAVPKGGSISRDISTDNKLFVELDNAEKKLSMMRQEFVTKACEQLDRRVRESNSAVLTFWNSVVAPLQQMKLDGVFGEDGSPAGDSQMRFTWRIYRDIVLGTLKYLWKRK